MEAERVDGAVTGGYAPRAQTAQRVDGRHGVQMARSCRKVDVASKPAVRRADGTRRLESRQGEHTAGAASSWHTLARRAEGRHGVQMAHGDLIVGVASKPLAQPVDCTRRPESWRGERAAECNERAVRQAFD
jgi:hypothetical protein